MRYFAPGSSNVGVTPVTLAWAIRFGREMKAPVGEASLELAGLVFPTGQGYELKLDIN